MYCETYFFGIYHISQNDKNVIREELMFVHIETFFQKCSSTLNLKVCFYAQNFDFLDHFFGTNDFFRGIYFRENKVHVK